MFEDKREYAEFMRQVWHLGGLGAVNRQRMYFRWLRAATKAAERGVVLGEDAQRIFYGKMRLQYPDVLALSTEDRQFWRIVTYGPRRTLNRIS